MNLYKLEGMKIRISTYLRAVAAIFASLLALGILCLFLGTDDLEGDQFFTTWNGLHALQSALTVGCFGVFAAVFAARVIVEEYCGKKAAILFTYPVSRGKILGVKSRMVAGATMAAAFASNVLSMGIMVLTAHVFGITPQGGGGHFAATVPLTSILAGVLAAEIGMIATAVGWKKRSATVTIVGSVIMVCFVPNLIASRPESIVGAMLLTAALLGLAAGLTRHMLTNGIEEMEV